VKKIVLSLVILVVICLSSSSAQALANGPLQKAVVAKNAELVKQLLTNGENVDSQAWYKGKTPLMLAAEAGNNEIVKILINAGADLNLRSRGKNTAMHYAAMNFHADTFHILLLAGANADLINRDYQSARMIATRNGWQDILSR
jgi:uncharacterized protein